MKKLHAHFIDAVNKRVEEIEIEDNIQSIYDKIGSGCRCIECPIQLPNGDVLYVDEEGRFPTHGLDPETSLPVAFLFDGSSQIDRIETAIRIVGNGLLIGTDAEGDSQDVKSLFMLTKVRVTFLPTKHAIALKHDWSL